MASNGTNGTKNEQDNDAKKIGTRVFKKSSPNGKVNKSYHKCSHFNLTIIFDTLFLDNHLFGQKGLHRLQIRH